MHECDYKKLSISSSLQNLVYVADSVMIVGS